MHGHIVSLSAGTDILNPEHDFKLLKYPPAMGRKWWRDAKGSI